MAHSTIVGKEFNKSRIRIKIKIMDYLCGIVRDQCNTKYMYREEGR